MHKQVADHAHLFSALRLVGYTRFRLPAWNEPVRRLRPEASDHETVTMLKTLFNYAVVGVPRVGGRGGGSAFEFVYDDRFLEPAFDGEMVVHPALRKQLNLKEARSEQDEDSD
jgi:hypothetical protein